MVVLFYCRSMVSNDHMILVTDLNKAELSVPVMKLYTFVINSVKQKVANLNNIITINTTRVTVATDFKSVSILNCIFI